MVLPHFTFYLKTPLFSVVYLLDYEQLCYAFGYACNPSSGLSRHCFSQWVKPVLNFVTTLWHCRPLPAVELRATWKVNYFNFFPWNVKMTEVWSQYNQMFLACQMSDTFLGLLMTFWPTANDNEWYYMEKKKTPFLNVGRFCKDGFRPCGEYQSKT